MGLRLIDILKYLGMLYLIFLLIMGIRIVINGGITSHDTPRKDSPKSQEMYYGCHSLAYR